VARSLVEAGRRRTAMKNLALIVFALALQIGFLLQIASL